MSKVLEISSFPPPRAGWGVRVEYLKHHLEAMGHTCVVLNIGTSRRIPSEHYETVLSGMDYAKKVWRFSRQGFATHAHVNGASPKGFVLTILAEAISRVCGQRCYLTFHAGVEQVYFPKSKAPRLTPVYWLLFKLPHRIICNSDAVKAKIVEYGVPPSKVVPIPAFSRQYLEGGTSTLPDKVETFYQRFRQVVFCYLKMRPMFFPEATVEAFARVAARRPDVGLLLCGVAGHQDHGIWPAVEARLAQPDLQGRVTVVDDFPHEQFLQALGRASICLRTHLSDGVCSSVLESLSLGVPVVASENGTRPPGVITYDPKDVSALAATLEDALERRDAIAATLPKPDVRDTLTEEALLLTS